MQAVHGLGHPRVDQQFELLRQCCRLLTTPANDLPQLLVTGPALAALPLFFF